MGGLSDHRTRSQLVADDVRTYDYSESQLSISGFELANLPWSTLGAPASPELRARLVQAHLPHEQIDWVHDWLSDSEGTATTMSLGRRGDDYVLSFPETADFVLSSCATSIEIFSPPSVSTTTIEHLLLDQVLPRVLAWRGQLVLHGAAVLIGSEAIVLLGESGRGKSTLTAKLASLGHHVLTDDGVVVRSAGTEATVRATYRSLRLLPDSISQIFGGEVLQSAVAEYTEKQRMTLATVAPQAASQPLRRMFFLAAPDDDAPDDISLRRMSTREVCLEIVSNGFELDPTDGAAASCRFEQAAKIANLVPGYSLSFPRKFSRLTDVCTAVLGASE